MHVLQADLIVDFDGAVALLRIEGAQGAEQNLVLREADRAVLYELQRQQSFVSAST